MKKKPLFLFSLISVILLKIVFDFVYRNYVGVYFASDLFFINYSAGKHVLSYFLLIFVAFFVHIIMYKTNKPSRIVILMYFLSVILPLLTLYGYQDASSVFILNVILNFILIIIAVNFLPNIKLILLSKAFQIIIITSFSLIYLYVYSYLILKGGLSIINFNLNDVYNTRSEFGTIATQGPFLGYFIPWLANVVNIVLLTFGVFKKKRKLIILAIALQLLLFGMTNFKSFLFAPLVAISIYYFARKKNLLLYSSFAVALMIIAFYYYFVFTKEHLLASMFIRRQFFVPANLHLIYFDYFSQEDHPFVYLSNSVLKRFIDYPFELSLSRVISWEYWGRDFGPNVGFLGDAYSHFGLWGMFFFSILLVILLKVIDSLTYNLPANFISAVIAMPSFSLINSAFFTTLLTHGFLIAVISLLVFRNSMFEKEQK